MQGIPGSGKSTLAALLSQKYNAPIYSTDDFWLMVVQGPTNYNYDPSRIGEAHRWNQQQVIEGMQDGVETIIVDNTNIMRWQAQPYLVLAQIFDYEVQVVRVQVPVETAITRQAERPEERRIPEEVIRRMADEMEDLL